MNTQFFFLSYSQIVQPFGLVFALWSNLVTPIIQEWFILSKKNYSSHLVKLPVFFYIAEKQNIIFSNIMQPYFVPSAEILQKLGASSVSLVPVGSANFSKRVTDCPEETVIDGMVRTGADLGSLGSFLIAGVLFVVVVRIVSTSSFPTMGNWCRKREKPMRQLLRMTTDKWQPTCEDLPKRPFWSPGRGLWCDGCWCLPHTAAFLPHPHIGLRVRWSWTPGSLGQSRSQPPLCLPALCTA